MHAAPNDRHPSARGLAAWTLVLFLFWSNSFVAIGYLLGSEGAAARFDPLGLTVARHLPVAALCLVLCVGRWPREALRVLRRRWRRLALCGLLTVPAYHLALYHGQAHGIPPPIASLETALAPLFLMLLAAAFLGEGLSRRKVAGFVVALAGLAVIASAKETGSGVAYPMLVALTALAPLSWALYSALTKPVSRECPPMLWAYLALLVGTLPLAALAPWHGGPELLALDGAGWAALLFLVLPCTIFGNAVWTWLVKHLPASSVGFTIFLNPPLTTISKAVLSAAFPAVFALQVVEGEWVGGGIVLLGLALALTGPRAAPPPAASSVARHRGAGGATLGT